MSKRTDDQIKSIMGNWSTMENAHAKNTESYAPYGDKGDKAEFQVTFDYYGRPVTFTRYGYTLDGAIREAQDGFQWRFGFWPGEPKGVFSPDLDIMEMVK